MNEVTRSCLPPAQSFLASISEVNRLWDKWSRTSWRAPAQARMNPSRQVYSQWQCVGRVVKQKERSSSSSAGHSHGRLDDWKGPGSGLALVAYRAVRVTQPDIAKTQMMPLKIRRHRRPMNRRRDRLGNVFANTARAQRRNRCCHGCHRSSLNVVTVSKLSRRSN